MPSPKLVSVPSEPSDPVPTEVRAIIELFEQQLAKVAFPDVDAAALRRHADELRAETATVARAREALDAATASRDAKLAALRETARRACAYAQIYSEAHPDRGALVAALAALTITAPPAPPASTGKRRGRPPRQSAELFDTAPSSSTEPS